MATILVLGAALGGLQTALLLAADGHDVTVPERDADPAPADAESARSRWRRPGIPQLRLTHLPRPAGSSWPRPIWRAWWGS
ncbi:hypothetical protein [Streptomyces sp. TLI_185]|uniref:hypothetical protein n=1 Tax=Streptomyces sp. TLI_185 TaxID=2485151 RepID=UPI000F5086CB|nr:hypothetical protein [Streptomyces sp. TLI_185]RPF30598.1 hypothetical protein EDD92_0399 [Streptomyces sp. TLI_185]